MGSAIGISSDVQTSAKKLTVQDEEVALRLLPTTTPAEIKKTLLTESPPDIKTCRIIVAPNSENLLAEDLLIDSGGIKESCNAAEKGKASTTMSKVEPIPSIMSPVSSIEKDSSSASRSYIVTTSSSRHNLDSIVEAIRHLEGDHLFTTPESASA